MLKNFLYSTVNAIMLFSSVVYSKNNTNVILFMIDGLHWEAPEKLNMPVFNSLISEGVYIKKSYMILPHHPTIGDYSKFNSCSFPNPILHSGTIFIEPENKYIQELISPKYPTAFVVNTAAYRSVSRGFTASVMDPNLTDDQVVRESIEILKTLDPRFIRIHLQTPGEFGRSCYEANEDMPFYRDIFGKDSPYVSAIENSDKLLGMLINYLKESGKWDNTVLIVSSDHGQSKIGWHPLFDEDSWATPLIISGPGIAKGRELSYFEHTDIAPLISGLMELSVPNSNGGEGRIIKEIMEENDPSNYNPPMNIKIINNQIKEYNILRAKMILRAEKETSFYNIIASLENEILTPEPFYHQDRIMDWHLAGTTEHLIEANEKILKQMRHELELE